MLLPTVVVGFERESYSISEGNGSVEVCVQVTGVLQGSLSVSLTTVDGTATGESVLSYSYLGAMAGHKLLL